MRKDKKRRFTLSGLMGMAALSFVILISWPVPGLADDVDVSCYVNGNYIDDVDVFDLSRAAQACNNMFSGCNVQCIGCYQDFDYDENVCVDENGRTFVQ